MHSRKNWDSMNRRAVLATGATLGVTGLAGCLGVVGMNEHASRPAGVGDTALDGTGYSLAEIEPLDIEETVDLGLWTEDVVVRNYLTEYEKAVGLPQIGSQEAAVFYLLTTPQVSVLGRELNPVGDMESRELVHLVEDNYDEMGNIQHDSDSEVTVLGQDATESVFTADAEFQGLPLDVYLHVTTAVEFGEDFLVVIAVYPELVEIEERENVATLLEGILEEPIEAED